MRLFCCNAHHLRSICPLSGPRHALPAGVHRAGALDSAYLSPPGPYMRDAQKTANRGGFPAGTARAIPRAPNAGSFADKLGRYPREDLEKDFINLKLRKPA